jgi:hypothetical protein
MQTSYGVELDFTLDGVSNVAQLQELLAAVLPRYAEIADGALQLKVDAHLC